MAEKKDDRENIILQQADVSRSNVGKEEKKKKVTVQKTANRFVNKSLKDKKKKEKRKPIGPLSIEELYILDRVKKHACDVFLQDDNYKQGPGKVIKKMGDSVLFLKKGMEGEDRKNFSNKWDDRIKKLQDDDFQENKFKNKNVIKLDIMKDVSYIIFGGSAAITLTYWAAPVIFASSVTLATFSAVMATLPIIAPIVVSLLVVAAGSYVYLKYKEVKLNKSFNVSTNCAKKSAEQTLDKMLDLKKQNPSIGKEELEKELCHFVEKDDLKYANSKTKKAMKNKSVDAKTVDKKIKEGEKEKRDVKEDAKEKKESKKEKREGKEAAKEKKESKKEKAKKPDEKKNKKDGQKNTVKSSKILGVGSIQSGKNDSVASNATKRDIQTNPEYAKVFNKMKDIQSIPLDESTLGKVKDAQDSLASAIKNVDQKEFVSSGSVKNAKEKVSQKGAAI